MNIYHREDEDSDDLSLYKVKLSVSIYYSLPVILSLSIKFKFASNSNSYLHRRIEENLIFRRSRARGYIIMYFRWIILIDSPELYAQTQM